MYYYLKQSVPALMLSALLLLPSTTRPIDKPAVIAAGALVGTVLGIGISYYLNEKEEHSENDGKQSTGRLAILKQFLHKYTAIRTFLIIALGASAGAATTFGILQLLDTTKAKDTDKPKPQNDDFVPKPRDESPEDRAWWQTLTKQSTFKNETELQQRNNEWSAAIDQHFQGKQEKIKIYKVILTQLIASEKRKFTNHKITESQKK